MTSTNSQFKYRLQLGQTIVRFGVSRTLVDDSSIIINHSNIIIIYRAFTIRMMT
jgi:hypothetical protein